MFGPPDCGFTAGGPLSVSCVVGWVEGGGWCRGVCVRRKQYREGEGALETGGVSQTSRAAELAELPDSAAAAAAGAVACLPVARPPSALPFIPPPPPPPPGPELPRASMGKEGRSPL